MINVSDFDGDDLSNLPEKVKPEVLAQNAHLDEGVLNLAEQITEDWWRENKDTYLRDVKR